jgi:hypothetical protein
LRDFAGERGERPGADQDSDSGARVDNSAGDCRTMKLASFRQHKHIRSPPARFSVSDPLSDVENRSRGLA